MQATHTQQRGFLSLLILFFVVLSLTACGSSSSTTSSSGSSKTDSSGNGAASATAAQATLIQKMTLVGSPSAKLVSGITFEVDGRIKNGDDQQHDIYVQVTLLDSTGKQVGTATQNVDNVKGNTTASFAIKGTAQQSSWSSVKATVVKVTEHVNGSGDD